MSSIDDKFAQAQYAHRKTIATFARNAVYALPGFDQEDLEQELLVVLWRCVANYDPDRGASFNTVFQGSAKNRIISLIRAANAQSRKTTLVYLDENEVTAAIENLVTDASAEDWYLAIEQYSPAMVSEVVRERARRSA